MRGWRDRLLVHEGRDVAERSAPGRRAPDLRMEAPRDPGILGSDMLGIGRVWWMLMSVSEVRIVTVATVRNLQAWRLLHPLVRLGQPVCPGPDNRHRPPNVAPTEST